jgi:hypothetical protein
MRLCDTVVKNISNVLNQLETHYPKAELVTYHYYLGRLALYQRRIHKVELGVYMFRVSFLLHHRLTGSYLIHD